MNKDKALSFTNTSFLDMSTDVYATRGSRTGNVTLYGNGEAVAMASGTGSRSVYLGKDLLGSVKTTTGVYGDLEDWYEYDAFGTPYKGDLSGTMNLGYTGKPYNPATNTLPKQPYPSALRRGWLILLQHA